jgi:FHA domain
MEAIAGDTQPLTQPVFDPRLHDDEEDEVESEDLADVILFLHPASKEALEAVRTTALIAPQHIRYKANLGPLDQIVNRSPTTRTEDKDEDGAENGFADATQNTQSQDISKTARMDNALALRFSSQVTDPAMGFTFGRNDNCDIRIRPNRRLVKISGIHFRIFVTDDGVVMLQDCSTNGTWVDNKILRTHQQHLLGQGTTIEVITWTDRQTTYTERASFTVTFPKYEDPLQRTRHQIKLETYLLQRARRAHGPLTGFQVVRCLCSSGNHLLTSSSLVCRSWGVR